MAALKKGQEMACFACGRKVIVDKCGTSRTTIWCCGQPMNPVAAGKKKAAAKK